MICGSRGIIPKREVVVKNGFAVGPVPESSRSKGKLLNENSSTYISRLFDLNIRNAVIFFCGIEQHNEEHHQES